MDHEKRDVVKEELKQVKKEQLSGFSDEAKDRGWWSSVSEAGYRRVHLQTFED